MATKRSRRYTVTLEKRDTIYLSCDVVVEATSRDEAKRAALAAGNTGTWEELDRDRGEPSVAEIAVQE